MFQNRYVFLNHYFIQSFQEFRTYFYQIGIPQLSTFFLWLKTLTAWNLSSSWFAQRGVKLDWLLRALCFPPLGHR